MFVCADAIIKAILIALLRSRSDSDNSLLCTPSLRMPQTKRSLSAWSKCVPNSHLAASLRSSAINSANVSDVDCSRLWKWKRSTIVNGFGSKCSRSFCMMSLYNIVIGFTRLRSVLYTVPPIQLSNSGTFLDSAMSFAAKKMVARSMYTVNGSTSVKCPDQLGHCSWRCSSSSGTGRRGAP